MDLGGYGLRPLLSVDDTLSLLSAGFFFAFVTAPGASRFLDLFISRDLPPRTTDLAIYLRHCMLVFLDA